MNIRDWIFVEDHCRAILAVLDKGIDGSIYNIGSGNEMTNLEIIKTILDIIGKPHSLIQFVKDRPGHDRHYAIDSSLMKKELGFKYSYDFTSGIKKTVDWYLDNVDWIERCINGDYLKYYESNYGAK